VSVTSWGLRAALWQSSLSASPFDPQTKNHMTTRRELANAFVRSRWTPSSAPSPDIRVPDGHGGHRPGPLGDFLKYNPGHPEWLTAIGSCFSNGHASMLLYSVLYLTGYPLRLEEIETFRQLGSRCAGHPEHEIGIGIETTTGPLGQGVGDGRGYGAGGKNAGCQFNKPNFNIVNHYTYVSPGDGCLMEGVSHEACSMAGTFGLGKLIVFYDDNRDSIDGKVAGWFRDDTAKRFEGYHWQVIPNVDATTRTPLQRPSRPAQAETSRPGAP